MGAGALKITIKPMLKNCDIGSLEQGGIVAAVEHQCMNVRSGITRSLV